MTAGGDLEIRGLSVEFRTPGNVVHAVRGIDLTVAEGRIVGLVGESGSGKSATALATLGLLHPRARVLGGSIRFEGRDLLRLPERELRRLRGTRISMVPQDPLTALNPALRIGTQLRAVLRSHDRLSGPLAPVAHELFEQVQLGDVPDLLGRHPHELSGGQRQRIVIAFALAGGTSLLIADEATTALDVTTQLQILGLLRERNERTGLSLLVISHDLSVIAEICHEVCVMREGAIVERGAVDEVLLRPSHPYTKQLLAALPDPTKRGEPLGVGAPVNGADG
jgi:peptide/nickel transport system ATP-binding protein